MSRSNQPLLAVVVVAGAGLSAEVLCLWRRNIDTLPTPLSVQM
jgi:hypothetical protein